MAHTEDLQKRDVILGAARALFFQFGFSKTSMDDIAGQAGLAKPTLYYYYQNKESIFNEVVIGEATTFMDHIESGIPEAMPADEKIAWFLKSIYEGLKKHANEMRHVPEMMCQYSPHGKPIVREITQLLSEKLRRILCEGKKEGLFEFDDENIMVITLVNMIQFLNMEWLRTEQSKENDQIIDTMIAILLNGIKRRNAC